MVKAAPLILGPIVFCALLEATVINTTSPGIVSAFQSGATVVTFEGIAGRTPQTITSYTSGIPVSATSFIFNQIS